MKSFGPQVARKRRVKQHCANTVHYSAVLNLAHAILVRCVGHSGLPHYSSRLEQILELLVNESSAIANPDGLDFTA